MATTLIGSLAINPLLPIQARGAGSLSFGPVAFPQGYSVVIVQIDLQQVASLTAVFTLAPEVSFDGGATWVAADSVGLDLSLSGYVLNGSVLTRSASDPLGPGPVRVFGLPVRIGHTESSTRQIRGTLSCTEACTSGATVVAY